MLSVLKEECNIPRPWCLEILNFLLNYSGRILCWLAYCPEFLTSDSGGGVLGVWGKPSTEMKQKVWLRNRDWWGMGLEGMREWERERLILLKGWRKSNKIPLTGKFRYLLNWTTWAHKQGADYRQRKKKGIHSGLGLEPGAFQMWRIIYT